MKISFENKSITAYKELFHNVKRLQESVEGVVPDVNDDIGKIASVQTDVLLKSKDINSRGVVVSGEAIASLLYITESEKNVAFVRLSRQFSVEFDVPDIDADTLAQIKLELINCEARVINPRKVSVTFELSAELSCFRQQSIIVDTSMPTSVSKGVHAGTEKARIVCTNCIGEKTFTLSEQFLFPGGKPAPEKIVSLKPQFYISDTQLIGTKLIVKGNMELSLCYISNEVNYPVKCDFSTAFSQIMDIGVDEMENCAATISVSTVYYDITNTINGEKALDAEIHAVLQIAVRAGKDLKYISDVYSNLMPAECSVTNDRIVSLCSIPQIKMISDERILVTDDCMDVLSVFTTLSQINYSNEKINAAMTLDIIYRTKDGTLSSVRRLMSFGAEGQKTPERLVSARLTDVYLRPDGGSIDAHAAVELKYICTQEQELRRVTGVELNEDEAYDLTSLPAVNLVRAEKETIWELAKQYHSSVECICSANDIENGHEGKLLLIPKSI